MPFPDFQKTQKFLRSQLQMDFWLNKVTKHFHNSVYNDFRSGFNCENLISCLPACSDVYRQYFYRTLGVLAFVLVLTAVCFTSKRCYKGECWFNWHLQLISLAESWNDLIWCQRRRMIQNQNRSISADTRIILTHAKNHGFYLPKELWFDCCSSSFSLFWCPSILVTD